jgi:hypothetical protein
MVLTPFLVLCCIGVWPERGFGELIWELPTLGPRAPFLSVRACRGSGDRVHLGSSSGPLDHPVRHALLGTSVVGPYPLRLALLVHPSIANGRGTGNTLCSDRGASLGPLLSGCRPNSEELVGFGGTPPGRPSIRGLGSTSKELA